MGFELTTLMVIGTNCTGSCKKSLVARKSNGLNRTAEISKGYVCNSLMFTLNTSLSKTGFNTEAFDANGLCLLLPITDTTHTLLSLFGRVLKQIASVYVYVRTQKKIYLKHL
jgi:hypothetical protein